MGGLFFRGWDGCVIAFFFPPSRWIKIITGVIWSDRLATRATCRENPEHLPACDASVNDTEVTADLHTSPIL